MARSQTFHSTNGTTQEWDIDFSGGYISKDHVKAYFYPTGNLQAARTPVLFTWVNATRIRISPALAASGKLLIQRETPMDDVLVIFNNTADFTRENLLTLGRQSVFVAAELTDTYEDPELLGAIADAKEAAANALTSQTAAAASATAAATSANTADSNRLAATAAAAAAASSATGATVAADAANTSATAASASASTAATSATSSATQASASATSATASAASATASAASATAAYNNAVAQSGVASYKGLAVVSSAGAVTVLVSCQEATLRNIYTDQPVFLKNINLTCDISTSGAGGIESGTPWLVNRWYALWLIYDGTTVSTVLSNSATSPNMPGGFTHALRIGWVKTNSTTKFVIPFMQNDDQVQWTNTPSYPLQKIATGVQGDVTTPTLVTVNVRSTSANNVGLCPSTAIEVRLHISWHNSTMMVSPNTSYGGQASSTNQPLICGSFSGSHGALTQDLFLESNNVHLASDAANNYVAVAGWRDTR